MCFGTWSSRNPMLERNVRRCPRIPVSSSSTKSLNTIERELVRHQLTDMRRTCRRSLSFSSHIGPVAANATEKDHLSHYSNTGSSQCTDQLARRRLTIKLPSNTTFCCPHYASIINRMLFRHYGPANEVLWERRNILNFHCIPSIAFQTCSDIYSSLLILKVVFPLRCFHRSTQLSCAG